MKRDGQTSALHQGETAVIEPGAWHDWWNAGAHDARVRVEIAPGERFVHMIETFFGLPRLGHTEGKGMPDPLARWRGYRATYPQLSRMVLATRT